MELFFAAQTEMTGSPEPEERSVFNGTAAVSVERLVVHHLVALQIVESRIDG